MRRLGVPVIFVAVLLAVAGFAGRVGSVAAQQEYPVVPDPAACEVEPRTADELIALWFTPDGSPIAAPAEEEEPSEVTIPLGEPADEETMAAIEAVVIGVFSCFEAGDFLAATALFSDELAASFGPEFGADEAEAREFLEMPAEPEEGDERILAITDVMVLADGRVGAFVVDQAGDDPPLSTYAIFVEEGDGWLVDEVIEFSTPAFEEEEEGTPAP